MALIELSKCQPFIGAEVRGVDLTQPIPPETADAIRSALIEHQVLVFRGQDISRRQHVEFANLWVRNQEQPFLETVAQANPIPDYPEIFNVMADGVNKMAADVWHTDESYRPNPPTVSILRAKVVPSLGGDTIFSSGIATYHRLPDEIKTKIRYLKALHGLEFQEFRIGNAEKLKQWIKQNPSFAQPVVRLHPESMRPVLFVNYNYTGPIVGLDAEENAQLRTYLFDQFKKPDFQMRVRWRPNTVVVWDNRSVQHYAVYDYNEPRHMERILVAGVEPAIGFADVERGHGSAVATTETEGSLTAA
jgi:alpha-ketoglutarate-dependent taurine dioxygenase